MNDATNARPRQRWLKPAILAIFAGLTLSGCHYYADDPYYGPTHSGPVYSGSGYYGPSSYGPGYYGPGYYRSGYYRSGYYRPVIVTGPRYRRGRYGVRRGIRRGVRLQSPIRGSPWCPPWWTGNDPRAGGAQRPNRPRRETPLQA